MLDEPQHSCTRTRMRDHAGTRAQFGDSNCIEKKTTTTTTSTSWSGGFLHSVYLSVHSEALREELCEWVSGKGMNEWMNDCCTKWVNEEQRQKKNKNAGGARSLSIAFFFPTLPFFFLSSPAEGSTAARAITKHGEQTHSLQCTHTHTHTHVCVGGVTINSTIALLPLTSFRQERWKNK